MSKQPKFIVWANHDPEGWKREDCTTFDEAVVMRDRLLSHGNSDVIITEYVPLYVRDARELSTPQYA